MVLLACIEEIGGTPAHLKQVSSCRHEIIDLEEVRMKLEIDTMNSFDGYEDEDMTEIAIK